MRLLKIAAVATLAAAGPAVRDARAMWVTAYYPAWRQGSLPPDKIDYDAVTHLVHFAVIPRPDGGLEAATNMMTSANIAATVSAAHAAGKTILFTVGGQSSRQAFEAAMADDHRAAFVDAIVRFLRDHGYDGVDVDMEDIVPADERAYERLIRDLRRRLDAAQPRPLLTAPVLWQPALFARLADQFDQINIMTYNLAGPYPGWIVWHSGALFSGGRRFPNGHADLPSVDGLVSAFLAAGVPRAKLGIGLSFDGYVWSGGAVNRPLQAWTTPPVMKNVPYYQLADAYHIREYDPGTPGYHWDEKAQAAYLSVGPDQFVSYQNEAAAERMVRYVRDRNLGGMIVWDLPAGYRAGQPEGRRDLLIQAVKKARLGRWAP